MPSPGWLTRSLADLPGSDDWLGRAERRVLDGLTFDKRRSDWRLGRFCAKAAVATWLGVDPSRLEIAAAADGAPEARLDGQPAAVALALSHRAGRALAVVTNAGVRLGCDIELVEPRSEAFIQDWLAPAERQTLARQNGARRDLVANLLWSAKEAAAKARREGLRLDLRDALVAPDGLGSDRPGWRALRVRWADGDGARGWWRAESGWVMAVAGEPAPGPPRALER
jgi:4'-phosphopantetheinyl transferase